MGVRVRIPAPMRRFTGGEGLVIVEAADLRQCIDALEASYPDIKSHLRDENGKLFPFANIFVNDDDARFLGELDAPLKDGDEVTIIPAAAGGEGP